MRLTESETRALLSSCVLVVLAVLGRALLPGAAGDLDLHGLAEAGRADSALLVAESLYAERARRGEPLAPGERIDLNTAPESEIDRLPGIGASRARTIVEDRNRRGPFRDLTDLRRVPGLGPGTVRRLAPFVRLSGGPFASAVHAPERRSTSAGEGTGPRAGREAEDRIDLNRASVVELQTLPGVGETRARAMVRWREEHGPFRVLEDLLDVPGIGPVTLERLRDRVRLGP